MTTRVFSLRGDHYQPIGTGLGAPRFAGTAEHLANIGVIAIRWEAIEFFSRRIEVHDRVCAPVGEPNLVAVVDPDRISMRGARQLPFAPRIRRGIVHTHLP